MRQRLRNLLENCSNANFRSISVTPKISDDQSAVERDESAPFADRYDRLGEVARGAIGRIDAAFDPVLGRRVAIKILLPSADDDGQEARKFSEEAQITGQLDHPNVVPIYDLGADRAGPFIVMKLVHGRTLGQILREHPTPGSVEDLQRLLGVLLRLCDALSFAHSRGVIHCDVKPDNVMVGDHGQVYLMDWGVALLKSQHGAPADRPSPPVSRRTRSGAPWPRDATDQVLIPDGSADSSSIRGTPAYMAREQLLGKNDQIDERTDVSGMGGVLYEILTQKPPNDRERLLGALLKGESIEVPRSSPLWPQIPPELRRIVAKALAPEPADRHPNIDALKTDIEQFIQGGGWFETRSFLAGARVVTEGELGDAAYIIESGECEVVKESGGRRIFVRHLGPGEVFGETAVFTGSVRTASVVALTDVTLKIITGESLNRELDRNPWLGAFVRSLAGLFREADARLSQPPALPASKE